MMLRPAVAWRRHRVKSGFLGVWPSGTGRRGTIWEGERWPALPALAEVRRVNGRDFLAALAMAIEIGGRVARSLPGNRVSSSGPLFFEINCGFTHAVAIFGAVAGAAKVLVMNRGHLVHSFGIAGYSMPAPSVQRWQQIAGPASVMKYGCSTSLMAQSAVTSCLMAENGFTANEGFLGGE